MAESSSSTAGVDQLKDVAKQLMSSLSDRALETVNERVSGLTEKLSDVGEGGGVAGQAAAKAGEAGAEGDSPIMGGLKGAASGIKDKVTGGGKGGKSSAKKPVNIYETIDVGVPLKVAYNQWTEYEAFTSFTRKVEKASEMKDESPETTWGAKIFLSHREWKATTVKQVPDERIVWTAEGAKGYPNGSVTFHELSPTMTRIILSIEYHPKGLFEKTGNIWRAQGRRVRSDFKQFPRHVMTRTVLHADEVEGWRGTIEDSEIVETHEEAVEREEQEAQPEEPEQAEDGTEESEEEYEEEPEEDEEPADDEAEAEEEEEYEEEPAEEEAEEEEEYEEEPAEEEEEEEEEEEPAEEEAEEEEPAEEEAEEEEEPEEEYEEEESAEEEEEPEETKKPRRRGRAK